MTKTLPYGSRLLNNDWLFGYGDLRAVTDADDACWYDVGLPHSFGIPYFMSTDFYVGKGTYRRSIEVDGSEIGLSHALEFKGVFQDATVWVNDERVGRHLGGYTPFRIDISGHLRPGTNVITVLVSNEWNPQLAPRAGEHSFNGGIYRDVTWVVAPLVRIGWYGTGIRSTLEHDGSAVLSIDTEIINESTELFEGRLVSTATFGGVAKGDASTQVRLLPGASATVSQTLSIAEARLWDVAHPHLYCLEQVLMAADAVDRATTSFGIRTIRFDANEGFFLNGRHLLIHGANVHQDRAGWSDAATHAGIARDIAMIREAGMNLVRGSHYPHHTKFADECDRQGMLFWSELCFWGTGGEPTEGFWNASAYPVEEEHQAAFEASCMRALEEMIRTHRNNPSIITWSMGNEVFFSDERVITKAKQLTQKLIDLAHRLDPTRPASVGGAQRRGFDQLGDLVGYNGDGASLFHNPGRPNIVSEYGVSFQDRPGKFAPHYTDGVEKPYPWRSGIVLWCGFHHGSIMPEMGRMGFIDYFRVPLRSWYWYRENLAGVPAPRWPEAGVPVALRLTSDRASVRTDGTEDVFVTVELVNAEGGRVATDQPVRLEVIEGGGIFPTGTVIDLSRENMGFLDGIGAIEFRSYYSGRIVIRATSEGMPAAELVLEAVGGTPWAGQRRRFQQGPPSKRGLAHAVGVRVLSEKRPVYASSSDPARPAHLITDYSTEEGWLSASNEPGAWVRLDLEGQWAVNSIEVSFGGKSSVPFHVETESEMHGQPGLAAVGNTSIESVKYLVLGKKLRAVIVRFPEAPAEISRIVVHGS
jgi:beta-galactosidase